MELADDITPEDLKLFVEETEEQLQILDEDFIKLERGTDPILLEEIFRAAHTIKGSSAVLGHQQMAQLAHAMENVLDQIRNGTLAIATSVTDALLLSLDTLKEQVAELVSSQDHEIDIAPVVAALESVMGDEGVIQSLLPGTQKGTVNDIALDNVAIAKLNAALALGQRAHRIHAVINAETSLPAVRSFQVLSELSQIGEILVSNPSSQDIDRGKAGLHLEVVIVSARSIEMLKSAVEMVPEIVDVEFAPFPVEEATPIAPTESLGVGGQTRKAGFQSQTVRIDVDRLDSLMNAIGELLVDGTRIAQISRLLETKYGEDETVLALGGTSARVTKLIDELRTDIMRARMLPIGGVFSGFSRMVRDLAQQTNKQVELVIDGQETEIDRTVIERVRDPLVHLIRNAVDHGIETIENRKANSKPEMGVVKLSAYHEQGQIIITIEDDGQGINPTEIKESAVEKKLISSEVAAKLTDAEALELIFMGGMSTAKTTSEVSGRGVGMDIVRTNIEAIHGFVAIETKVGHGTKFTLRLPTTLAILYGLLINCHRAIYAIPLVYVIETLKVRPEDVYTIGGRPTINLRDHILPLLHLGKTLGVGNTEGDDDADSVVVVRVGERTVGLVVDSLMEPQEIVVKSLGQYIGDVKGISGTSVLGDGRMVLILDVATLMNRAISRRS